MIKSQLKKKTAHYYENKSYATILVPDKIYRNLEIYNDLADMNLDGIINILDVVQIVNIILK